MKEQEEPTVANPPQDSSAGSEPAHAISSRPETDSEKIAELRQIMDYRSLMMRNLAHDLRTPLTAILGFAEILVEFEALTDSQKSFCTRIQSCSRELQNMIQILSDLAQLDVEDPVIVRREFSLRSTLEEMCGTFSRAVEKNRLSLTCEVAPDLGLVNSDQGRLRQTLYNVLANAIARSPQEGRVTINATANGDGDLMITIGDEGDPPETASGVDMLDAYIAGASSSLQRIGLDISQGLAKLLGATIEVEQRSPRGLSVVLLLPRSLS